MLPKDPNMLLSVVNMQMRDKGCSLEEVAASNCVSPEEIKEKLQAVGYHYDEEQRRFLR